MSLNSLIRWLKPREMVFFDLLDASTANLLEATKLLEDEFTRNDSGRWNDLRRQMKELEHTGDRITHDIIDRLDHYFVTPIEREDILALAHALDDVVDCLYGVTERLVLYRIPAVVPAARELSTNLVTGASELVPLVKSLRDMKDIKGIRERIQRVHALENQADSIYHGALAELYENPQDPYYLMKWREILALTEDATDGVELVAKVIGSTVMRNA